MLGDLDWHRFANGDFVAPLRVGRLDPALVLHLGCTDSRVYIHPTYAPKIVFKHKITPYQMPMLGNALQFGTIAQDRDRTLSAYYEDDVVFGKIFHTAIKVTGAGHELWVRTFHKLTVAEFNRRLRKSTILRPQI